MTAHPTLIDPLAPARAADVTAAPPVPGLQGSRRPVPRLLGYYALRSLLAGPFFPFVLLFFFFRYRTLRYNFDADGVSVRWGILFRREVSLTYARIQDIHLVSNVVERWLGLGRVQVQTASGNAAAELTIEGLPDYERVRDELYVRMRGARGLTSPPAREVSATSAGSAVGPTGDLADVAAALNAAVAELRALREALSDRR